LKGGENAEYINDFIEIPMTIELLNICKQYQNGVGGSVLQILNNISLTVKAGESIAVIGPSGSGKSTLLNIIGILDEPTSGEVIFDGLKVNSVKENELARIRSRHIGFVFQMHYLLPQLNLLENVLVPVIPEKDRIRRKAAQDRAMDLLQYVGLADKIHQFPGSLSGGECQRAAVVRALVNSPGIVLADEPTGSLDHDAALLLGEMFQNISKMIGVSVIVVTHSMELAAKMDQLFKLVNGSLIPVTSKV
jgi:lipoprotein-releasing system ATP-binding protein